MLAVTLLRRRTNHQTDEKLSKFFIPLQFESGAHHFPPPCLDLPSHVAWLCTLTNYVPTLSPQPEKAVPPPQSNNQSAGE